MPGFDLFGNFIPDEEMTPLFGTLAPKLDVSEPVLKVEKKTDKKLPLMKTQLMQSLQMPVQADEPTRKLFTNDYIDSLAMRNSELDLLKQKLNEAETNKPTGLAALNLRPFAAFTDSLTGQSTAKFVDAPQAVEDNKALVNRLYESINKNANLLSDDQLNFLKLKAGEDSAMMKEKLATLSADRAQMKTNNSQVSNLREEWLKNPLTKASQEVATSYEKVQSAAKDPSAAGDLSLIFGYMKMLDPGSVVREGEFATAQNAAGVPDRVRNQWNRLQNGERLNPNQRTDFINQAANIYRSQMDQQNRFNSSFQNLANRTGVSPENVVLKDMFKEAPTKQPAQPQIKEWQGKKYKLVGDTWTEVK